MTCAATKYISSGRHVAFQEENPATDDERRDKDAGGSSRHVEHGDGRGEKEPRETTTEIAYVGVATA